MGEDHINRVSSYDRLFDPALSNTYNLSIRPDPDGLSFSVYSTTEKLFLGIESHVFSENAHFKSGLLAQKIYKDNFVKFVDHHPWIKNHFNKTSIIFCNQFYTLLPNPLFDPDKIQEYLRFVHGTDESWHVAKHQLKAMDSWLIYGIHNNFWEEVATIFPNAGITHHIASLIDSILPRFKHSDAETALFLNVRRGFADIIALRENALVFVNTFECPTNEDIVYFLMYVMDQLKFNPEKTPVYLTGYVDEGSHLATLILRYVRNVEFLLCTESASKGYAMNQISTHRFYDLLIPAI